MAFRTILSALLAASLRWHLCVLAEDAKGAPEITKELEAELDGLSAEEPPKAEGEAAAAEEGTEGKAVDPEAYAKSAIELQEKLGQLKALLDAKGEGAGAVGSNRELTEFITGCVTMTARRVGLQRPSTIATLTNLAKDKWTRKEASREDFFKMVASCITEFTEQELQQWKAGKMSQLPKSYVDMAKKPEAEKMVLDLEDSVWAELVMIGKNLIKELTGGVSKEAPINNNFGLLAMIPMVLVFAFLGLKFRDMLKRNEEEKKKKDAKAAKKQK